MSDNYLISLLDPFVNPLNIELAKFDRNLISPFVLLLSLTIYFELTSKRRTFRFYPDKRQYSSFGSNEIPKIHPKSVS